MNFSLWDQQRISDSDDNERQCHACKMNTSTVNVRICRHFSYSCENLCFKLSLLFNGNTFFQHLDNIDIVAHICNGNTVNDSRRFNYD